MDHPLEILPQPDDTTCGPTCLHSVYRYFGEDLDLDTVIEEVDLLEHGGTLAALLGKHALGRGYTARLWSWNLQVFDPTWFRPGAPPLEESLRARYEVREDPRERRALTAYLQFLEAGGEVRFEDLTRDLLERLLEGGQPVLAGVCSTYLYDVARDDENGPEPIRGDPCGHFVVVKGFDREACTVSIADPYRESDSFDAHYYEVGTQRFLNALLLGIVSYDANFLVLTPREAGAS